MTKFAFIGWLLISCLFILPSCKEEQLTQETVVATLDTIQDRLLWIESRLAELRWDELASRQPDSAEFYRSLRRDLLGDNQARSILARGQSLLDNDRDQRRLELLHSLMLVEAVEANSEIRTLRDSVRLLHQNYRAEYQGRLVSRPRLMRLIGAQPDRVRRELAYRSWAGVAEQAAQPLEQLIRLRGTRAKKLGYNDFSALALAAENLPGHDYSELVKYLKEATDSASDELLTRIRQKLGLNMLELWDLPAAFHDISNLADAHFPVESQLVMAADCLERVGFDIDQMPIYYSLSTLDSVPEMTEAVVVAAGFDQRVRSNLHSGLGQLRQLLEASGVALLSSGVTESEPLFRRVRQEAWSRGVGYVIGALCEETTWLETQTNMPASLAQRLTEAGRDEALLSLRFLLVDLQWELEAYQGQHRDLNALYWEIFDRYFDLPRHEEIPLWALRPGSIGAPMSGLHELQGRMIAAQTIAYLKSSYGSLTGNHSTYAFLDQNYFRYGGRYDWRELVQRGTGGPLDADHLLSQLGI